MKCACELLIIHEEAMAQKRAAEIAAVEAAKSAFAQAVQNTVQFCDTTLDEALTKAAQSDAKLIYATYKFREETDKLGNIILHPVVWRGDTYADGRKSYVCDRKVSYSKAAFEQYLADNCLTVSWGRSGYDCWGCGYVSATEMCVKVTI